MTASQQDILEAFRRQAGFCRDLHQAHLTAAVIDAAAGDIQAGGPLAKFVENFGEDPWKDALALRVTGALHYLVIKDRAPALAPYYCGDLGLPERIELQGLVSCLAVQEEDIFRRYIAKPPQTNEVKRAAALLPGFSMIARATGGLPMNIYELGASGGLLLAFDKFSFDYGDFNWGSGDAVLKSDWRGGRPDFNTPIEINKRLGCDRNPIDLSDADQIDMMHSYIWPEQSARHHLFDAAVGKRLAENITVDRSDALEWTEARLQTLNPDKASVFFHSVFAVYLDEDGRRELDGMFEKAGARATRESPLARLSFEPVEAGESFQFMVTVQTWPGEGAKVIARAHAHGEWVEPLAV